MNRKFQISNFKFQISALRVGFTLIELILVVAVMAIFSTLIFYTLNPFEQLKKGSDSKRKSDLSELQRALETYYHDFGAYPSSSGDYRILNDAIKVEWGSSWAPYMTKLPADSSSGRTYVYYSPPSSGGQSYYIYASLERGAKDNDVCNGGDACSSLDQSGFPSSNACIDVCNYGVSSPNVSP